MEAQDQTRSSRRSVLWLWMCWRLHDTTCPKQHWKQNKASTHLCLVWASVLAGDHIPPNDSDVTDESGRRVCWSPDYSELESRSLDWRLLCVLLCRPHRHSTVRGKEANAIWVTFSQGVHVGRACLNTGRHTHSYKPHTWLTAHGLGQLNHFRAREDGNIQLNSIQFNAVQFIWQTGP